MPHYHKLGKLPRYKHTTFYKEDGKSLYREELVSAEGFSDIYSNKYHIHLPTATKRINELQSLPDVNWKDYPLQHMHFVTDLKKSDGDFFTARNLFMHNSHVEIWTANPTKNPDYFYRNAHSHEYIFVHHGKGTIITEYGKFKFEDGDQIIIYQGMMYQMFFDDFANNKLLIVESDSPFEIPNHFVNKYGQFEEHAPLCERDIKVPDELETHDIKGEFRLILKANKRLFEYILPHHPFDVVGWDGFLYPWAFNIKDYNPKVGKLHLPPPVHLLFVTKSFVLCNFCPRLFDFHPEAVPAPYFHHNIESAEVLYYAEGDFMSRKGISEGSITLHPVGIPHGPQPGKTEQSVGAKDTFEYAVMVDTFQPLFPTTNVRDIMDRDYWKSWLED